jgi:uncharacterized membrane protein YccC
MTALILCRKLNVMEESQLLGALDRRMDPEALHQLQDQIRTLEHERNHFQEQASWAEREMNGAN